MTSNTKTRNRKDDAPMKASTRPEHVRVVVVVNHEQLKAGEIGEVELTDVVRQRLDRGYMRLATEDDVDPGELVRPLGETTAPPPVELTPPTLLGVQATGTTEGEGGGGATSGTGDSQD
jgi:hypothetical protein